MYNNNHNQIFVWSKFIISANIEAYRHSKATPNRLSVVSSVYKQSRWHCRARIVWFIHILLYVNFAILQPMINILYSFDGIVRHLECASVFVCAHSQIFYHTFSLTSFRVCFLCVVVVIFFFIHFVSFHFVR